MIAAQRLTSQKKLVLASSSPRRKEIMSRIFSEVIIDPPKLPEKALTEVESPEEEVLALARDKAEEVALRHRDALVIGCDTCVRTEQFLGKPRDRDEARRMLQELSGDHHTVISAVWVIDTATNESRHAIEKTKVFFDRISEQEMEDLLESGEYEGKAGAYAIQGLTGLFVRAIEGDYNNVMGLPMRTLYRLLKELGI
ncbi:MAG: septum formation protein Maf [Tissierellia bacterium]|nr:Maf family protein [Bacillota bacterium]NLL23280.1 septum formation protein Maf [Tissierellia bacterium]